MNNLRTLLLIPVFFIQITGFMMSRNIESYRSFELSENRAQEIKRQASTIDETPSKDVQLVKKDRNTCENNSLCRKEALLKGLGQPPISNKSKGDLPAKTDTIENKKLQRKVPVISLVRFIGTVNEELF